MDAYLGEYQDIILGQEFLTWLWYMSEAGGGAFTDAEGREYGLFLEQRIQVQGGEGDNLETTTVAGAMSELKEARLGLATGKKVTRALVRMEAEGETWQATIKAEDFSFSSLKTPKVQKEDDDEPDALFLEKIYLVERFFACVDDAFEKFMVLRLSGDWSEEARAVREWIMKTTGA